MFEQLTTDARRVFVIAQQEARNLRHTHLGTEHLLAGLAIHVGAGATLLADRGCGPDEIRADIVSIIGLGCRVQRDPDALLATLGIDLGEVRRRVESTFGAEAVTRAALRGPRGRRRLQGRWWWPNCAQGRPCDSALLGGDWLRVAPRVRRVLELAVSEAAPVPATPLHLLVGILGEGEGVACQILARRGVDLPALAKAARAKLG
jgi:hypothetical protein